MFLIKARSTLLIHPLEEPLVGVAEFRPECVGDEKAGLALTADRSLPDVNVAYVTRCKRALKVYYYVRTMEENGFIRIERFCTQGLKSDPPSTAIPVGWELPPVGSMVISTAEYSSKEPATLTLVPP